MAINSIPGVANSGFQNDVAPPGTTTSPQAFNTTANASSASNATMPSATDSVTLSDLARQLSSADTSTPIQTELDAPSPSAVLAAAKAKKSNKSGDALLDVDAFRVARTQLRAILLGKKPPDPKDAIAPNGTGILPAPESDN